MNRKQSLKSGEFGNSMLDLQRHVDCPLWEGLEGPVVPWNGMKYACIKVIHAYCKVFDQQELYDLIVR